MLHMKMLTATSSQGGCKIDNTKGGSTKGGENFPRQSC